MIANSLSGMSGAVLLGLGNHLWQSTSFVLVIASLTFVLRKNYARTRYWLWLTASMKFLVPFSLLVILGSDFTWLHHPSSQRTGGANAGSYLLLEEMVQPFTSAVPQSTASGITRRPFMATRIAAFLGPIPLLPAILATVWLSGFLVVFGRWTRRWLRIRTAVRTAMPVSEGREVQALRRMEDLGGLRRRIEFRSLPASMEPGIFGLFQPVLLWPQAITTRLEDAHLEAVLAHEVCHVRGRDNLTAGIHMVVEAIFWFHPLVWWLETRLVEEREHACDEKVLQMCGERGIYAESILRVCKFCVESPLACVSGVSGSDLKRRIIRIMTEQVTRKLDLTRKLLLGAAGLIAVAVPVVFGVLRATQIRAESQVEDSANKLPAFEVASIKPNKLFDGRVMFMLTPDGISVTGVPMQMILRQAFGVEDDRILGAPSWVKSDRFEIQAKVAVEDVPKLKGLTHQQRFSMVLPLLTDRFNLKYHHDSKELPVYVLEIAKGGTKMKESKPDDPGPKGNFLTGRSGLESHGSSIESLTHQLAFLLGRTVLDKTGLTGAYDYSLAWVPDDSQPEAGNAPSPDASGPSLFTALQEQLGLKLESQKGPVDVIVIDHIERPSEN